MKAIILTTATIGILSGIASASPFPFNLFERQVGTCPQLPPAKFELVLREELEELVKGLSLNGTGTSVGRPIVEKPQVKLEAIAPNNTTMFSRVINRLAHPWNTIGKVWVYNPAGIMNECTATLVAPNVILTAAHCIPRSWDYLEFVPAFDGVDANPRPFGTAYSSHCFGYIDADSASGLDYVTCRLNTHIGRRTGTMGYLGWWNDGPYERGLWTAVGYPHEHRGGRVPVVQEGVSIDDVDDETDACGKELEDYNVYSSSGWDGGPMFRIFPGGGGAIAGVVSGVEGDFFVGAATVHAGGVCMLNIITYTISIWTP